VELLTHGPRKYPHSSLMLSSAGRGWSTISAELRAHGVSEMPAVVPQQLELTIAVRGNTSGLVRRSGAGQRQETRPIDGTIWMSPIEVTDNVICITEPLAEMLHLFLPKQQFGLLAEDYHLPQAPARCIRYLAGIQDELIRQIGLLLLSELKTETAAGRMLVETSSLLLAARLAHSYADFGKATAAARHRLDNVRLRRVLDYIATHLEGEIALADLASVACLSQFHFARVFAAAVGMPPHRYVSRQRLENAMAHLAAGKLPLSEIALRSRFSSQASFNRAFRRTIGMTPGQYRRQVR